MNDEEKRLSLVEASRVLGISEQTARNWVKSGKLEALQPGAKYQIPQSAIDELLGNSVSRTQDEPEYRIKHSDLEAFLEAHKTNGDSQ